MVWYFLTCKSNPIQIQENARKDQTHKILNYYQILYFNVCVLCFNNRQQDTYANFRNVRFKTEHIEKIWPQQLNSEINIA